MKTNEKRKKVLSGVLFSLFSFSEIEVGYKWYMIFSLCVSPASVGLPSLCRFPDAGCFYNIGELLFWENIGYI